ncbi:MAG: hypothetical protein EPN97_17130 [Alphaproteobacteria bacterium]|nr:MAG: hypothetical protein EPN97_17130 [Alphaproteobacteria bacterium]
MARDLQELEDFLWEEFDAARKRHKDFIRDDCYSYSTDQHPHNYVVESREMLASLAGAIVAVRRERRVEKFAEDQQKIEEEIANGTRRDVMIGKPLKIKP